MWWQDEDSDLAATIDRLVAARHEGSLPGVHAIGSSWTERGHRTVYVGVDAARDPRPATWAPGASAGDQAVRRLIHVFGPLAPRGYTNPVAPPAPAPSAEPPATIRRAGVWLSALWTLAKLRLRRDLYDVPGLLTVPLSWADVETREVLSNFGVPRDTRVGYIGPLRPAAQSPTGLLHADEKATAGCGIKTDAARFITTAGHLGASPGEQLHWRVRRFLRRDGRSPCGRVIAATSPGARDRRAPPGLDLAIVRLEPDASPAWWRSIPAIAEARKLMRGDWCRYNGGETGRRRSFVSSIVNEGGNEDAAYQRLIQVTGKPRQGAAKKGDSGTAAYTDDGLLVGHIVAVDGLADHGVLQIAYIQSAEYALSYFTHQIGGSSPLFGDLGQ